VAEDAHAAISPRRFWWLLLSTVLGAAVLRMVRLHSLPPGLFRDEAEKVYNAWCLLKTGRDVNGQLLPLFIEVFGVTTSAIYQYAAVPFVALFGLNEWSARLPAAMVGTATVLVTALAARRMFGAQVALWSAVFLALSPWHVVFSRWAQQGIFLPLLLGLAVWAWAVAVDAHSARRRTAAVCVSAMCLALAMYAYDVARLFVPLLVVPMAITYQRFVREHWRAVAVGAAVFLLALSPVLYMVLFKADATQARFRFVTILQPGASAVDVAGAFLKNYAAHFSPGFLLFRGDAELRHGAGVGVLTPFEFFAVLGGATQLVLCRRREHLLLFAWLLLFPFAASLTRVGIPHALRSIVALPAVQIIAAIGVAGLLERVPARWRPCSPRGIAALLAVFSFLPFARAYYGGQYSVDSAVSWQYGVKQALQFLDEPPFHDAAVYIDTATLYGAEYLVAVYKQTNPQEFQRKEFGRYHFIPPGQAFARPAGPAAYVHVPLIAGPVGWRPIAYFPLDEPETQPVLMVYLDPVLQQRIRAAEAKR